MNNGVKQMLERQAVWQKQRREKTWGDKLRESVAARGTPACLAKTRAAHEQWDDVPKKTVGKRRTEDVDSKEGYQLQTLVNELGASNVTWPKGVFRFESHEHAEKWWTDQMIIMK
ncbi:MAG: hypothetical protein PHP44_02860 [Kiritimatiellae bacterium]|nr:hypothetical protein [Kiritimatiellia bacterium]